jgi:adenosylcobalamin-dependent ribonucleoside-triphosphate reductase
MNELMKTRATVTTLQKYCRLKTNGVLETPLEMYERTIAHQRFLWARQLGHELDSKAEAELAKLLDIQLTYRGSLAGRTKWLGGTEKAKTYEVTNFNCAGLRYGNVHAIVNAFWLLLQGCGVSILPECGGLHGFSKRISNIKVIRSTRIEKGQAHNMESLSDGVWTICVGDSAEAWAKALGKLVAHSFKGENIRAHTLILDFSNIRGKGQVTSGYGWKTSGDEKVASAFYAIANILNSRIQEALSVIDLLDIFVLTGETLSSRRSAGMVFIPSTHMDIEQFMRVKREYWKAGKMWRSKSNNTVFFDSRPTLATLTEFMHMVLENGESGDPGLCNAVAFRERFSEFMIGNPCFEEALPDGGLCNQVSVNAAAGSLDELFEATYLLARAAYRQTCVNLLDGILDEKWHRNNANFRFIGLGLMGLIESGLSTAQLRRLKQVAVHGALSMADELGLPYPYYVTTVKPEGTMAKSFGVSEGLHHPLARHIFNWQNFSGEDPVVALLEAHGYQVKPNPLNSGDVLVNFPIEWSSPYFRWTKTKEGVEVELHSAVAQLERYKRIMTHWVDTNASFTVSYLPEEVPAITDWLFRNWDSYVGTAFMPRFDASTVEPGIYLPQTPVTSSEFYAYRAQLKDIDWKSFTAHHAFNRESGIDSCEAGACGLIN